MSRLEAHPLPLQVPPSLYLVLAYFQDIVRRGEIIDNDMEDELYLRRLDAGLFILQHICYIMAEICNASVPQVGWLLPPPWPRMGRRTILPAVPSLWVLGVGWGQDDTAPWGLPPHPILCRPR